MDYSAKDLLRTAREVLSHSDTGLTGVWPRATAHLCRQALELALEEFWKKRMPGLVNANFRHPDFREITMRRTRAKARDYRGELTLS